MAEQWSNESNDIFERFAAGIDDAVSKGESLDCADRDLNYAIKLQHERLEHHGVTMKMNITPRGLWTEGFKLGRCQGDDHFEFYKETRTCKKDESYYKNGRRLYRNVDNYKLYQTVTDFATEVNPAERQYKCPSCGAISTVSQLVAGCPYCGTKFKTSEFYPKISNFYFNLDIGYKSGRTAKLCKWTIPISTAAIFTPFLGFALIIYLRSLQNTGVVNRATGIGGILDWAVSRPDWKKYNENVKMVDVHINPNLAGYGATSFGKKSIDEMIKIGEQVGRKNRARLEALKKKVRGER